MSDLEELDYVEAGGPGIPELPAGPTPEQLGAVPAQLVEPQYPGWEEEQVNEILLGLGAGMHLLLSENDKSWLMTQEDLRRIGKPATRILNRWEPALRASPYVDPFLVAKGLALYGWRSALEDARTRRDRQAAQQDGAPARASYQRAAAADADADDQGEELLEELQDQTYFPARGDE